MKITCSNRIIFKSKVESRGFTLVELLVVMSIISIMASVVLVSLQSARDKGRIASGIQQESAIYQRWGTELVGWWKMESILDDGGGKACTKNEVTGVCDVMRFDNNYDLPLPLVQASNYINIVDGVNSGKAFNFIGKHPWVVINTGIMQDFTYTAWVKLNTQSNPHAILTLGKGGSMVWQIENNAICYKSLAINPYPIGDYNCSDQGTVAEGKWVFIVTTFNGSNSSISNKISNLNFYVDGKLVKVFGSLYFDASQSANSGADAIGGYGSPYGDHRQLMGYLDEVRIYKNSISVAQIEKLYAEGLAKHSLATSN